MRKSINTRLIVAFVSLVVIPLLVVGGVTAWQSFTAQRQQTLDLQREIAQGAPTHASSFVNGLEQELGVAATLHRLTQLEEDAFTNAGLLPETGSSPIRVLVVDDQEVVRRGIRSMLDPYDDLVVVGEAGDGEEAIERIRALAPGVVLLDTQMPKLDGVETTRLLREAGLEIQVILLSVYAEDEYIFDGLRAGTRGYILKDAAADDLSRAIRTVHRGGSLLQPIITTRLIERLDNGAGPHLTDRELEVLRLLASGARNKEIAGELTLSVGTDRFHLQNIYQKLDVQGRTQAVRVATKRGFLVS